MPYPVLALAVPRGKVWCYAQEVFHPIPHQFGVMFMYCHSVSTIPLASLSERLLRRCNVSQSWAASVLETRLNSVRCFAVCTAVTLQVVNLDTPDRIRSAFFEEIQRHLQSRGFTLHITEEPQAWTMLLHVPGQRLDTAHVLKHLHNGSSTEGASFVHQCPGLRIHTMLVPVARACGSASIGSA